jgi:hypothetical protein
MGDHSLRQKSVRQITKDDQKISGKSLCQKYLRHFCMTAIGLWGVSLPEVVVKRPPFWDHPGPTKNLGWVSGWE